MDCTFKFFYVCDCTVNSRRTAYDILRMITHIDFTCGRFKPAKYQHPSNIPLSIAV